MKLHELPFCSMLCMYTVALELYCQIVYRRVGSLFETIRLLGSDTSVGCKISRCLTSDIFGKFRNMFPRKTSIHSNRVLLLMNQVISNSVKRRVSLSVQHQKHYIHLQFKSQNWQDPVDSAPIWRQ